MLSFHSLFIKSVVPETAQAVVITFAIPPDLRDAFEFIPGQFLTLKAHIGGEWLRRSYSICSSLADFEQRQAISVAIKQVENGQFSTWAQGLQAGDTLDVMPPDGRFVSRVVSGMEEAKNRLFIAAGSGITPILSMLRSQLASGQTSELAAKPPSQAQLIYGNQRLASVMFFETLQDLKNSYPTRLSVTHVLSRQHLEVPLFNGRLDAEKLKTLIAQTVNVATVDEAFICGPEGMIEAAQAELLAAGLPESRIHTERFASATSSKSVATKSMDNGTTVDSDAKIPLSITADGITHTLAIGSTQTVLEVALAAGLDLPYSCKAGVCCTCRAKLMSGSVHMQRNFTLEPQEVAQGYILTCQSCPTSAQVVVSFDER